MKFQKMVSIAMVTAFLGGTSIMSSTAVFATEIQTPQVSSTTPLKDTVELDTQSLENDLRFMFETASTVKNGEISINMDLLTEKYGAENAKYLAQGIYGIHHGYFLITDENGLQQRVSFSEWAKCMGNELIGMIPGVDIYQLFVSGDAKAYYEGKMWGELAEFIAKKLVKLGVTKTPQGFLVSVAISAGKCLF